MTQMIDIMSTIRRYDIVLEKQGQIPVSYNQAQTLVKTQ